MDLSGYAAFHKKVHNTPPNRGVLERVFLYHDDKGPIVECPRGASGSVPRHLFLSFSRCTPHTLEDPLNHGSHNKNTENDSCRAVRILTQTSKACAHTLPLLKTLSKGLQFLDSTMVQTTSGGEPNRLPRHGRMRAHTQTRERDAIL